MCRVQGCVVEAGAGVQQSRSGPPSLHPGTVPPALQVGFVMRLEGGRLAAHLEEQLPDYTFAFEGGSEGAAGEVGGWVGGWAGGRADGRVAGWMADAGGIQGLAGAVVCQWRPFPLVVLPGSPPCLCAFCLLLLLPLLPLCRTFAASTITATAPASSTSASATCSTAYRCWGMP